MFVHMQVDMFCPICKNGGVVCLFLCDCLGVCVLKTLSWDFNDRSMHFPVCILMHM